MSRAGTETTEDRIFKALANPVRRALLDALKDRPQTTGELCAAFPALDRCTVMQHLKVLEKSGLVRSRKAGRVRTYSIEPQQLKLAEDWLERQRSMWVRRLDRLDSYLMKMKEENSE